MKNKDSTQILKKKLAKTSHKIWRKSMKRCKRSRKSENVHDDDNEDNVNRHRVFPIVTFTQ